VIDLDEINMAEGIFDDVDEEEQKA